PRLAQATARADHADAADPQRLAPPDAARDGRRQGCGPRARARRPRSRHPGFAAGARQARHPRGRCRAWLMQVWLLRHAETEWSRDGRHTGRTDVPLTDAGRERARALRERIAGHEFALVLSSPLQRARETAELAGLTPEPRDDLLEFDYGG